MPCKTHASDAAPRPWSRAVCGDPGGRGRPGGYATGRGGRRKPTAAPPPCRVGGPDLAAVALDDLAHDGQTEARARARCGRSWRGRSARRRGAGRPGRCRRRGRGPRGSARRPPRRWPSRPGCTSPRCRPGWPMARSIIRGRTVTCESPAWVTLIGRPVRRSARAATVWASSARSTSSGSSSVDDRSVASSTSSLTRSVSSRLSISMSRSTTCRCSTGQVGGPLQVLDVGAQRGERRPQLVAGVGDEALLLIAGRGERGDHACSGSGPGSRPRPGRPSATASTGRRWRRCPRPRRGAGAPAARCARPAASRAPAAPTTPARVSRTSRSFSRSSVDSVSDRSRAIWNAAPSRHGSVSWRYRTPSMVVVRSNGSEWESAATARSRPSIGSCGPWSMQLGEATVGGDDLRRRGRLQRTDGRAAQERVHRVPRSSPSPRDQGGGARHAATRRPTDDSWRTVVT